MHKNLKRQDVDLHHLEQQRLYQGLAVINKQFAQEHANVITHLHTWDYGFWFNYLDLQQQALGLASRFSALDESAEDQAYKVALKVLKNMPEEERLAKYEQILDKIYEPVINEIIQFWQENPTSIYGSLVFLHGMAKTFFRNKVSYEEPMQGRQIKQIIGNLKQRKWDQLRQDLCHYRGWWN